MNSRSTRHFILPFIIVFALFGMLGYELFYSKPQELPSTLIGEKVPHFSLPTFTMSNITFNDKNLTEHVSLLNVWASWCSACGMEAPFLMKIKNEYHIPIYGIAYKDQPASVQTWLRQYGNPFVLLGNDKHGVP